MQDSNAAGGNPHTPPERHAVSITRMCLRSGSVQLPYALMDRLPEGEVLAVDTAESEALVLWFEPPRTLHGFAKLFENYELQVNDELVFEPREQELRVTVKKRPRRSRPKVQASTWSSVSDDGSDGPKGAEESTGEENAGADGPARVRVRGVGAPQEAVEPDSRAPSASPASHVEEDGPARFLRRGERPPATDPADAPVPHARRRPEPDDADEDGFLGGLWRRARGWFGGEAPQDAPDEAEAPTPPEPVAAAREDTAAPPARTEAPRRPTHPPAGTPPRHGRREGSRPRPQDTPPQESWARAWDDPAEGDPIAPRWNRTEPEREARPTPQHDAAWHADPAPGTDRPQRAEPDPVDEAPPEPGAEAGDEAPQPATPVARVRPLDEPEPTDAAPDRASAAKDADPSDGPAAPEPRIEPPPEPKPEPRAKATVRPLDVPPEADAPAAPQARERPYGGAAAPAEASGRDTAVPQAAPEEARVEASDLAEGSASATAPPGASAREALMHEGDLRTRLLRYLMSPEAPLIVGHESLAERFELEPRMAWEMLEDVAADPPPTLTLTRIREGTYRLDRTRP